MKLIILLTTIIYMCLPAQAMQLKGGIANEGNWYKIPSWMCGTWTLASEKQTSTYDCTSHRLGRATPNAMEVRADARFGLQKDTQGNVWQSSQIPFVMRSQVMGLCETYCQHDVQFMPIDSNSAISTTYGRVSMVNTKTSTIADTWMQETASVYTLLDSSTMLVSSRLKIYSMMGGLLSISLTDTVMHKVSEFQPVDELDGKDIRTMFENQTQSPLADNNLPDIANQHQ